MKQALKIKLRSHSDFQIAWLSLIEMGYHCPQDQPHTAPYLYAHEDGTIHAAYFDVQGADLHSPNSAEGYFNAHISKEVTLAELKIMAFGSGEEAVFAGVDPEYDYYCVDADGSAWYTKREPYISKDGFWDKDISIKIAPNFKLHSDWTLSLMKRTNNETKLDGL